MFETVSLAVAVALPGRDAVLLRVCTTGGVPDRLDAGGRSFGPLPGASTGCAGFLLPERLLQGRLRLSTGGRRCSVPAPVLVSPAAARILESSWRREQSARTALAEQAEHVVRLERRVLRERRRPGTGARGPERRRRGLQATALLALSAGFVLAIVGTGHRASDTAVAAVAPPAPRDPFTEAGRRYGLAPAKLRAVADVESRRGLSRAPGVHAGFTASGVQGPMQFLPSTWAAYGLDANGDGVRDPYDLEDAVGAAAAFLRAHGAPGDWRGALYAYNPSAVYVDEVLRRAQGF